MKKLVVLVFMSACVLNGKKAQQIIPLYKEVPNSKPAKEKEVVTNKPEELVSKVSTPTLLVYLPKNGTKKSPAIVICPGGGYAVLAIDKEGKAVAQQLAAMGFAAFVLKYRLPDSTIMTDKKIGPLQDAQRAIQMVRENAAEWNIDTGKVGIMGFSAGGHLAATASTHFADAVIDNPQHINLRPNFSVLIYPVISFDSSIGHLGSRENLIGAHPSNEEVNYFSNELQVTSNTPPAFLIHASDDEAVNPMNSILYYEALQKNKVKNCELHIYAKGGHGFGLHLPNANEHWIERFKNWWEVVEKDLK
ncbi:MAG: alpha/beta hydrolase [Chitinophagaceae bacterium]|jgi:acetyl esterase/lipase|nr:alpha/beta hydrolase [Chitinophagaceae bacterium]